MFPTWGGVCLQIVAAVVQATFRLVCSCSPTTMVDGVPSLGICEQLLLKQEQALRGFSDSTIRELTIFLKSTHQARHFDIL